MTSDTNADDAAPPNPPTPTASSRCPPILRGIQSALGPALLSEILNCRILLVGAGGIGCELLKNLALSGFRRVEIIDLDTIDVSNLNRQFLFRSRHVGMPKCVVASEAALRMVPPLAEGGENDGEERGAAGSSASYLPHHDNVFDNSKFNVPYFRTFALVLNALDNVAARRRVNRLCLAASVPLVEAGTAGYLGQVTVIDRPSATECYECQAKPTQKVYPICTIRSTPSQPVHCIVWAKELYKLCFGTKCEDSMLFEDEESLRADAEKAEEGEEGGADAAKEGGDDGGTTENDESADNGSGDNATGGEKSTYMGIIGELRSLLGVGSPSGRSPSDDGAAVRSKAREALAALFDAEIRKQIGMDRYKTADTVPVPVSPDDIASGTAAGAVPPTAREGYAPTDVWGPSDCVSEIASCLAEVAADASPPSPEFDKDDDVAMRFVAAASNLRSRVFSIEPLESLYGAKGIAGNIIPAIATTNAIAAGLQVLQCFHILKVQLEARDEARADGTGSAGGKLKEACRYVYCLRDKTRKGYFLQPTSIPGPNPGCFVCRGAAMSLSLDTRRWTLDMLLRRIVKRELGFAEPTIMIGDDSIVYEEGEDIDPKEYGANLVKRLADLPAGGLGHGTSFRVEDFTQDLEVEVTVSHRDSSAVAVAGEGNGKDGEPREEDDREEIEKFEIGGEKPISAGAPAKVDATEGGSADAKPDDGSDDDDDIEVIEAEDVRDNGNDKMPAKSSNGSKAPSKKRPPEGQSAGNNGAAKKAKPNDAKEGSDDAEVIELD